MKRKSTLIRSAKAILPVIAFYAITASLSSRSEAQQSMVEYRKGEVIIEVKPDSSIDAVNARRGTTTIQRVQGTNIYLLATPNGKKENKWRKRLKKDTDVLTASLNAVMVHTANTLRRSTPAFQNSTPTAGQSREDYINQQLVEGFAEVRARSRGAGVIVAVIDTGIALSHPDISSHIRINPLEIPADQIDNESNGFTDDASGWDFLDNDNDPSEARFDSQPAVSGHGTFVAGLIALVAPDAKIIPIRAFDSSGLSDAFTVAAAVRYAADQGARVINLSFSSPEDSQLVRDAVVYARNRGALLVAPAGNENKDIDSAAEFPAGWNQDVQAVAAIDSTGLKADFSNYGSTVSVSAPGMQLYSPYPPVNDTHDYAVWSGTSFAASLVTASAALILEDHPATDDLRGVIETTATSVDDNNPNFRGKLGRGRINPLEALRSLDGPGGGGGGNVERTVKLIATGIDANAVGEVRIKSSSDLEELEIFLNDLNSFDNYTIIIDGFSLGRVTVDGQGRLLMKWSTQPDEGSVELPPEVRPLTNIGRVEVLDAAGRVVLTANVGP